MARASTILDLRPGDVFSVRQYPERDRPGYTFPAHVSVDLVDVDSGAVWVQVSDPAALDGLITSLVEARDWLAAEVAGQPSLPVEPEPVGDTGLTLHPLPVGVS